MMSFKKVYAGLDKLDVFFTLMCIASIVSAMYVGDYTEAIRILAVGCMYTAMAWYHNSYYKLKKQVESERESRNRYKSAGE